MAVSEGNTRMWEMPGTKNLYGVEIMEMAMQYILICRTDPLRMNSVIEIVTEDISKIIQAYAENIQVSYRLMMDLKDMIQGYLIKNELMDLFSVKLKEVNTL